MDISIYKVDAFTEDIFGGNYAAVCPLDTWLKDKVLLNIAKENNLPETVFYTKEKDDFQIRWFTPELEMDLCGHATLAAAHVIFEHEKYPNKQILFNSASGELLANQEDGMITLDFPSRMPEKAKLPKKIAEGMGKMPVEVYKSRDYVLVYETEADIIALQPNRNILDKINLDPGGIVATAKGDKVDFVSRFFTPQASIFEDPVTGSAHCSLVPFWANRLGKLKLNAKQLSQREGYLQCELKEDRVMIAGKSVTYLVGKISI